MGTNQRARDLEIAAAFGLRVREIRLAAGLTQEALAEKAGLHATFISNIERGYRVPSVPTLIRIANALETTPGNIVDGLDKR